MGIFSLIRAPGLSSAKNDTVSGTADTKQNPEGAANSSGRFAPLILALGGLTGLGGASAYLSDNNREKDEVAAKAFVDFGLAEEIGNTASGVSNSYGKFISSLADQLEPPDDPISAVKPLADLDSVSVGMSHEESIYSSQDLLSAASEPSWVKRLRIGRFVGVSDEGLSSLGQFKNLIDISITGGDKLTGAFLENLNQGVKSVCLENLANFDGANLSALSGSHSLRDLVIRGCPVSIAGLTHVCEMKSLESLVLVDTGRSLTEVIIALPEKGLRNVVIGGFANLGDEEMRKLQGWVDTHEVPVTLELEHGDKFMEFLPNSGWREYGFGNPSI